MDVFRKTFGWLAQPASWGTEVKPVDDLKVRLRALPGEIWSRARSAGTVYTWCRVMRSLSMQECKTLGIASETALPRLLTGTLVQRADGLAALASIGHM